MQRTLLILVLVLAPALAAAETTVVNETSASANTGGNTAQSGEVVEGRSESSVRVYTQVNGEVVADVEKTATDGEEVFAEEHVESEDGSAQVSTEVKASAGTSSAQSREDVSGKEAAAGTSFSLSVWLANVFTYVFGIFK